MEIEVELREATAKHNEFLRQLGLPLLPVSDSVSATKDRKTKTRKRKYGIRLSQGLNTMASISKESNGRKTIQFGGGQRKRKSIRLGKASMKTAEEIKTRIEYIDSANRSGIAIDPETAQWLARIDDDLAGKLAAVGLIPAPSGEVGGNTRAVHHGVRREPHRRKAGDERSREDRHATAICERASFPRSLRQRQQGIARALRAVGTIEGTKRRAPYQIGRRAGGTNEGKMICRHSQLVAGDTSIFKWRRRA